MTESTASAVTVALAQSRLDARREGFSSGVSFAAPLIFAFSMIGRGDFMAAAGGGLLAMLALFLHLRWMRRQSRRVLRCRQSARVTSPS